MRSARFSCKLRIRGQGQRFWETSRSSHAGRQIHESPGAGVNRRDSARPPQRSTALAELERLVRQLGQPDQGLLDAASETMHGNSVALDLSAIPKFLEDSAEICVAAHTRWRESTPEQRALLRGCSLDLIGLAADQCLRLDRSFGEFRQSETDVKGAGEQLSSALERAEVLAEQARSVIQTVSGVPQPGVPAEVEELAAAFTSALTNLRDTARELLERGSASVRKRCNLYALDQAYVQTLEVALGELAGSLPPRLRRSRSCAQEGAGRANVRLCATADRPSRAGVCARQPARPQDHATSQQPGSGIGQALGRPEGARHGRDATEDRPAQAGRAGGPEASRKARDWQRQ